MKLDIPSSPIKSTPLDNFSSLEQMLTNNFEQVNHYILSEKIGVTAIVATIMSGPELRPQANKNKFSKPKNSSKKVSKQKKYRILLDSGSNGDLLFHEKGTAKSFPYLVRQDPKIWSTSNRDFQTKGKGSLRVNSFEYSNSKEVYLTPDKVEYEEDTCGKPAFDLIIGAQTMTELGIILDFKEHIITIDEIILPMQSINDLPSFNKEALSYLNCLANDESISTELATQQMVKILDVN